VASLLKQHTINFILDKHHSKKTSLHYIAMSDFMLKQCLKIKSSIIDINNWLNKVFSFFDSLNKENFSDFYLVNTFSNYFSFHSVNWKDSNILTTYCNRLENIYENSLINQDIILIISDISIKNNVATLVSYIHRDQEIIAKSVHYIMNITSIEAKLFIIRYRINHTIYLQDITCITIITDTIPDTKHIFNMSIYLY